MLKRLSPAFLIAAMAAFSGCASVPPESPPSPRGSGTPIGDPACLAGCPPRSQASLPHFFQVDEHLYRGGQPTADGFRHLAAMGVKTVVSLRAYGRSAREEQADRRLVESLGMRWVSLPMRMYWRPSDAQVQEFLDATRDPARQPVFVHCQHGEDRTGSLVAVYRVVRSGWLPARAYHEALSLGLAPWNPFTRTLIRDARRFTIS